jgi:hypothetical protein
MAKKITATMRVTFGKGRSKATVDVPVQLDGGDLALFEPGFAISYAFGLMESSAMPIVTKELRAAFRDAKKKK